MKSDLTIEQHEVLIDQALTKSPLFRKKSLYFEFMTLNASAWKVLGNTAVLRTGGQESTVFLLT